jgi:hypothetical protein
MPIRPQNVLHYLRFFYELVFPLVQKVAKHIQATTSVTVTQAARPQFFNAFT